MEAPRSAREVAALLAAGGPVRPVGGGTKQGWGLPAPSGAAELSTAALTEPFEHNEGDLTAVLGAGIELAEAQRRFGKAGQRLALDPPNPDRRATIGGVIATGDSGPLRHRFGSARDLILGVQVALADGTVARAGSKVIKNVAGYDLAKLMCGSLGTLGVVCEVTLRLHPMPAEHATAVGRAADADTLAAAARTLSRAPLELEALDLRWDEGAGTVLAGTAGHSAPEQAEAAAELLRKAGCEAEVVADDAELWAAQRAAQRSAESAVVRISTLPTRLPEVMRAAPCGVARAGLGLAWAHVAPEPEAIAELRDRLAPSPCVVLDAPEALRAALDPWGVPEGPELALMRRVKERFDPHGVCNPGRYVGAM